MKILIFGFTKLSYMPYAQFYLEALKGNELHLLTWNREGGEDIAPPDGVVLHEFSRTLLDEQPKYKKLPAFFLYRRALVRLLKSNRFDFLVVLHTLPGVLICRRLCRAYKGRYILDYRDYTFESVGVFRRIVAGMTCSAALTFVSSDGFRKYLPSVPGILTSHNLLTKDLAHRKEAGRPAPHTPIRVSFWGYIRHETVNKTLIDSLKNDPRFELHYYGKEQETASRLKAYCAAGGVGNVYFHGSYLPEERCVFARNTELIHNMYDPGGTEESAMTNKFYDGLVFTRPQVCSKGSYMGALAEKAGVGIALLPDWPDFADRLYKYYTSLDFNVFESACEKQLAQVLKEYNDGVAAVNNTVKGEPYVNF